MLVLVALQAQHQDAQAAIQTTCFSKANASNHAQKVHINQTLHAYLALLLVPTVSLQLDAHPAFLHIISHSTPVGACQKEAVQIKPILI